MRCGKKCTSRMFCRRQQGPVCFFFGVFFLAILSGFGFSRPIRSQREVTLYLVSFSALRWRGLGVTLWRKFIQCYNAFPSREPSDTWRSSCPSSRRHFPCLGRKGLRGGGVALLGKACRGVCWLRCDWQPLCPVLGEREIMTIYCAWAPPPLGGGPPPLGGPWEGLLCYEVQEPAGR